MKHDPGPFDPAETPLVVTSDATVVPKAMSPGFYAELESEFDGFAGCSLISRHTFAEPWDSWEMHPMGDEIVCLLEGDVDFVLWVDGAEQIVRVGKPDACVVVPKGVWHTVRPHAPASMLFITPGEGTQNAAAPPAD